MVVGIDVVHKKMAEYLRANYGDKLESFEIPYVSLYSSEKETYYRIEVRFKKKDDPLWRSAIAKADPETGDIIMFKEGYRWEYWL